MLIVTDPIYNLYHASDIVTTRHRKEQMIPDNLTNCKQDDSNAHIGMGF